MVIVLCRCDLRGLFSVEQWGRIIIFWGISKLRHNLFLMHIGIVISLSLLFTNGDGGGGWMEWTLVRCMFGHYDRMESKCSSSNNERYCGTLCGWDSVEYEEMMDDGWERIEDGMNGLKLGFSFFLLFCLLLFFFPFLGRIVGVP